MTHECADPATCPNPKGLCGCGCGEPTGIARTTGQGRRRGCPTRYLTGHHRRKSPRDYAVDQGTGCWLWLLATTTAGYAVRRRRGRNAYVHRLMYEERHGPIPVGLELDHRCRHRHCINPDHLEAVPHAENIRRGGAAKLTRDDVAGIRSLRGTAGYRDLAEGYGVTRWTIGEIMRGRTWREGVRSSGISHGWPGAMQVPVADVGARGPDRLCPSGGPRNRRQGEPARCDHLGNRHRSLAPAARRQRVGSS